VEVAAAAAQWRRRRRVAAPPLQASALVPMNDGDTLVFATDGVGPEFDDRLPKATPFVSAERICALPHGSRRRWWRWRGIGEQVDDVDIAWRDAAQPPDVGDAARAGTRGLPPRARKRAR
jgi:hypothetical protein